MLGPRKAPDIGHGPAPSASDPVCSGMVHQRVVHVEGYALWCAGMHVDGLAKQKGTVLAAIAVQTEILAPPVLIGKGV
jgi:hypothetical protein